MKKDLSQNKPSIPEVVPSAASTKLTLQQLNKTAEKKESDLESMRTRCKTCFKEIAPNRLCGGHGGGGGGSESGSGKDSDDPSNKDLETSLTGNQTNAYEESSEFFVEDDVKFDEDSFDPEVIAELVAKGLLQISSDRDSLTLLIQLQCKPEALTNTEKKELVKFMHAILTELDEFKKENKITDKCFTTVEDKEGNILSLRIKLPTLALYDAFIQRLAANLVPVPQPKLQEGKESQKNQAVGTTKEKVSTEDAKNKEEHHDELTAKTEDEDQPVFNPSPFSTNYKL
jgi:hypothetical protein